MNKIFKSLLVAGVCCSIGSVFAAENVAGVENWVTKLKEEIGEQPCPGKISDLPSIREDKHPGEQFLHVFNTNIDGTGVAISERMRGWWKTRTEVPFRHETLLIIKETIISTEYDLSRGVIRSKYQVQKLDEHLISAKVGFSFGPINTVDILQFAAEMNKQYGEKIDVTGNRLIGVGAGALIIPEVTVTKGVGVAALITGGLLKLVKYELDKVPPDGWFRVESKTLQEYNLEYKTFVTKIHELEGVVVESRWECGKGYTDIRFKEYKDSVPKEDIELIAKLIYRSNPVASWSLYPKKVGDVKTIDAAEIGGMVFTNAVEFNKVTGQVQVKNRGIDRRDDSARSDDYEYKNLAAAVTQANRLRTPPKPEVSPADIQVSEIGIINNGSNVINLSLNDDKNKYEQMTMNFMPRGSFHIIKSDAAKGIPSFVCDALLTGKMGSFTKTKDNGWWSGIQTNTNSLKVSVSYTQIFLGTVKK